VLFRSMDPDYTVAHGLPQTTDDEYNSALQRAKQRQLSAFKL